MTSVPASLQPMTKIAAEYVDDAARLQVLAAYDVDALEDDPELCAIVRFAAKLCNAPAAQVTLIERERQRFLAREGIEERETPRSMAFCAHTMLRPEILEVPDASTSELFSDNPLVIGAPFVRYYAGFPLVSDEGAPLGALCVVDLKAHAEPLSDFQREGLAVLAGAVMRRLNARRENLQADRNLAQSEHQLRILADSMPAIVWSARPDGTFDYFNQQLIDYVGSNHKVAAAIHPDDFDRADTAWRKAIQNGTLYEVEVRLRNISGEYRWMLARALSVRGAEGQVVRWFGTAVDIDEVHKLSESRDLLARELSHRIKNLFAVATGLISLKARKTPDHAAFADEINQALLALGRAHNFVRPAGGETRESLHGLLHALFEPYSENGESRVHISGDDFSLSPRAATPLALVFHELATNSAKYGALSSGGGHISLVLSDGGETIGLNWQEIGGPPPSKGAGTTEDGFGSRLVEMSVSGQLGGTWERHFDAGGLRVNLAISKQAIAV